MKKSVLFLLVLCVFALTSFASDGYIVFLQNQDKSVDEVMKSDFSNRAQIIERMKSNFDRSITRFRTKTANYRSINIDKHYWSVNAVAITASEADIERLKTLPEVRFIVKDLPVELDEPVAVGTPEVEPENSEYAYGLLNINVPKVWDELGVKGRGAVVGIIDTGITYNHPEFKDTGKIIRYWEGSEKDMKTAVDSNGHGSHVAGTIAGGNLSGKHIGVAPEAKLIIAKGIGGSASLLTAMEYMLDPDGNSNTHDFPRVVNCSWHSGYGDQNPYYEMLERWLQLGIVPAFSAGNSGPNAQTITKPKEFPGVFATAAADINKTIARFSSRGPAIYKGQEVSKPDWAAPGVDVYSVKPSGGYTTMSGTSMASPHIAGVVALMVSANPKLGVEDIRDILKNSTHDAGDPGYDYAYGHGNIDAFIAVKLAKEASFVEGKVTAGFGKGVAAEITVKETGRIAAAASDGSYRLLLFPGKNTLVFSAFGYLPVEKTVYLNTGQTTKLDVSMSEAPKIAITGKIKETGWYGAGIPAKITVLEVPDVAVQAANDGSFRLEIVAGFYTLSVSAFGYETKIVEKNNYSSSTSLTVELDKLPPVVLIDKDSKNIYQSKYTEVLDTLNVKYHVHSVSKDGDVQEKDVLPFHLVIWFTGDLTSNTVTAVEQAILTKYLQSGGSLLITGQDIGYNIKSSDFYTNYLKARYIKDSASSKTVTGFTYAFNIDQKYPDVIEAINGSEAFLDYSNKSEGAAVRYKGDYRLVYFGFGLEGIQSADTRKAVMDSALKYLEIPAELKITRLDTLKKMVFDNAETKAAVINYYEEMLAEDLFRNYSSREASEIFNTVDFESELIKEALFNRSRE